jgi:hypothetical protein
MTTGRPRRTLLLRVYTEDVMVMFRVSYTHDVAVCQRKIQESRLQYGQIVYEPITEGEGDLTTLVNHVCGDG